MLVEIPKRIVQLTAMALIVLAVVGAYQGWRGAAGDAEIAASTDGLLPPTNPVSARPAAPLQEAPPVLLTEAQIRTIARQEAQAALARSSEDIPSSAPVISSPAPSLPAPPPVERAPPAPPPTPPVQSSQPPLF